MSLNLQYSIAVHKHNLRGSLVLMAIAAAFTITLALVCHSHTTDGWLFCLSLGPGHLVGYLTVAIMAFIIVTMAKGAWLDAKELRTLQKKVS